MSRESVVFLLGMILFVLPHLGIPAQWKIYIYTGIAVVFIYCGYSLRRSSYLRSIERTDGERSADSFAEHVGGQPAVQHRTQV